MTRVFSFGGGVQSHAVLVLQTRGELAQPFDYFVFANVGADSENPATLDYIETVTRPFAEQHGLSFVEVHPPQTLYSAIMRDSKSIVIPAYTRRNGGRLHRNCTVDFKVKVIARWIREQGYARAEIGLGISLDEFERARDMQWYTEDGIDKRREYPLIDARLTRSDCLQIIASAGLPEPEKSSCYFCPFRRRGEWIELKKQEPDLFKRAVAVDERLRGKAVATQPAYLHPDGVPLAQAVADQPLLIPELLDNCESGYCWT